VHYASLPCSYRKKWVIKIKQRVHECSFFGGREVSMFSPFAGASGLQEQPGKEKQGYALYPGRNK